MSLPRPAGPGTRTHRRAAALAASAGALAMVAGGLLVLQPGASADQTQNQVAASCSLAGSTTPVKVPVTTDDKVDPIAPGATETFVIQQGLGQLPVEVTINKLVVTWPIPAAISSTPSVTFSGGNMKASYEVSGHDLVVTFTGPVSSKDAQIPTVTADHVVAPGTASGSTIYWKTFSKLTTDTNYGTATCTPDDPGQVLNTTKVEGGGPGSSVTTPPTTAPGGSTPPGTTPPTTTPPGTTPPTTAPPGTTPPTTTPPGTGGPVPGLPLPALPVPLPSLPALPVPVPSLPAPSLPSLPAPSLPTPPSGGGGGGGSCLGVPLPPGASLSCPVGPAPSGTPGVDAGVDAHVTIGG